MLLLILAFFLLALSCSGARMLAAAPGGIIPPRHRSKIADIEQASSVQFYISSLSGAIACSLTHTLMVPLDFVKTRMQTDLNLSKMKTRAVFRQIRNSEGGGAFLNGIAAVSSGYFMQGAAKFGLYDFLKVKFQTDLEKRGMWSEAVRLPIYLTSSAIAEFFATVLLCPYEVTKIQMMTASFRPVVADNERMVSVMRKIVKQGGVFGLWKGFPLVVLRQVPYSMVKLASYDLIQHAVGQRYGEYRDNKDNKEKSRERGSSAVLTKKRAKTKKEKEHLLPRQRQQQYPEVQIFSGVVAGVLAATLSHPADVLLSKLCGGKTAVECVILESPVDVLRLVRELGFSGCFNGWKTRAAMVGAMSAMQFLTYEQSRVFFKRKYADYKLNKE